MRASDFVIEAAPATTNSADDIRAAIATGVSQAQRDRYDRIPSTILPSWMHGLKGALTGDFSGKKDDAVQISKVVQDLKKDQPQDYGFPAWNNQRLIDTAKNLLTGQIAPPDLAPTQQDQYKEKVKKNYQQQQQQQPPKPVQQPVQQQSSSQTPPVGAVIPKSKNLPAIKWTGDAWTSMDGVVKYATTPDTIARLNQAYSNAKKAGII